MGLDTGSVHVHGSRVSCVLLIPAFFALLFTVYIRTSKIVYTDSNEIATYLTGPGPNQYPGERSLGDKVANVQALIDRVLKRGYIDNKFEPILQLVDAESGHQSPVEFFEIDGDVGNNRVIFRGTSAIALTTAFGHYLRYYLKCDFMWENAGGYQFKNFPITVERFPIPSTVERIPFASHKRYYQVCFGLK